MIAVVVKNSFRAGGREYEVERTILCYLERGEIRSKIDWKLCSEYKKTFKSCSGKFGVDFRKKLNFKRKKLLEITLK